MCLLAMSTASTVMRGGRPGTLAKASDAQARGSTTDGRNLMPSGDRPLSSPACRGRARGRAGDSGERLGCVGERQQDRVRYPKAGRPPPAHSRDLGKDLAQCHVFPAKNVALADPPAIKREQVARSDVVYM